MQRVNIPELDSTFSSIASAFKKQQENRGAMEKAARRLKELLGCPLLTDLVLCLQDMQEQHRDWEVQVHVEGYSFSLMVKEDSVPDHLQQIQQHVEEL